MVAGYVWCSVVFDGIVAMLWSSARRGPLWTGWKSLSCLVARCVLLDGCSAVYGGVRCACRGVLINKAAGCDCCPGGDGWVWGAAGVGEGVERRGSTTILNIYIQKVRSDRFLSALGRMHTTYSNYRFSCISRLLLAITTQIASNL